MSLLRVLFGVPKFKKSPSLPPVNAIKIRIPRLLWVPSWNIRPRLSALRLAEITLAALLLFWVAEFWGLQQERNAMEASLASSEGYSNDDPRWGYDPLHPEWASHEYREDRLALLTIWGLPFFISAVLGCLIWELLADLPQRGISRKT